MAPGPAAPGAPAVLRQSSSLPKTNSGGWVCGTARGGATLRRHPWPDTLRPDRLGRRRSGARADLLKGELFRGDFGDVFADRERSGGGRGRGVAEVQEPIPLNDAEIIQQISLRIDRLRADAGS